MPAAFAISSMDVFLKPCRTKTVRAISRRCVCLADSFPSIFLRLTRMAINVQFVWLHFTYLTLYDNIVHKDRARKHDVALTIPHNLVSVLGFKTKRLILKPLSLDDIPSY